MRNTIAFVALALAAAPAARAEEGMWMPQQLPQLADRLGKLGFTGDPRAFADLTGQPMGAVVSLGGCSAAFVSPDGLIATNHHCIQGALQYLSTPEHDLVEEGHVARTRAEELWNGPGSRVFVTVSVREVTDAVTGKLDPRMDDVARAKLVEKRVKAETARCEKSGLRCTVASFFEGARYFALGQLELEDVRLVYAPQNNVGNFGGETDNWTWPRHSGDFALYRAYVGKDGKSRPHAADNVPYRPAHFLPLNPAGISPGELALVAGYPGRTYRLNTVAEVKDMLEWTYPRSVRRYGDMLGLLAGLSKQGRATAIKATTRVRGLSNSMKKMAGVLEGVERQGLLAHLDAEEKALLAWIDADPKRKAEFGGLVAKIDEVQARKAVTRERDALFVELYPVSYVRTASLMGAAKALWQLADERPKPDAERKADYQQRNWGRIREALQRLDRSYDPGIDRALLRYTLLDVAALPADQRIAAIDQAAGLAPGLSKEEAARKIDAFLDGLYASTKLSDKATRLALFEAKRKDLQASQDGFVKLAIALAPMEKQLESEKQAREGARSRHAPAYARARIAHAGGLLAPDANSTLRVTFGVVEGVAPRDGVVYTAQTRLGGVLAKHRAGDEEFDVPAPVREAIAAEQVRPGRWRDPKLGDVPVNSLASVDITGGNSGSAVLDGKGRFVGLMFDSTWEAITGDLDYDPASTRAILVDVRYLLWSLENVAKATNLLDELGVKTGAAGN